MIRPLCAIITMVGACCALSADAVTETKLDSCITYYQDGEYQKAVDSLKALLPLIADPAVEAEAYKYLGFSYVMLDMINKAKDFFRVALEKFPQMLIDTLEVPPNITIVFKQAQLEKKMAKGEILDQEVQRRNEKRLVVATVLTATGAAANGIGGYFLFHAHRSYRHYHAIDGSDDDFQRWLDYWGDKYQKELLFGGIATGIGVVTLGVAIWLFFKKTAQKKISVVGDPAGASLVWHF
ncbi:MAG: hypothetical protein JXA71_11630 [Chitinispirillaceae bacterium]|nr:hypothetical protein [Chitinispirillaceae bacterium]